MSQRYIFDNRENNYITLNEVISLRGIYEDYGLKYRDLIYINKNTWKGQCIESIKALRNKSEEHEIIDKGNLVLIYRKGYVVPHFVSFNYGQSFYNPFWSAKRADMPTQEVYN